jgi:hypothetical protein
MATAPNPLDSKYAPGAEQARQDVMIGVSVAMTLVGGQCLRNSHDWEFADVLSCMCCTPNLHARVHRRENGHGRLDDGCSYGMLCRDYRENHYLMLVSY